MIKVICHRGLWSKTSEHNKTSAVLSALREFDGVEIDLRSGGNKLVLAHDPPINKSHPTLEQLLRLSAGYSKKWWALNIKQDGLLPYLKPLKQRLRRHNFFFFDLSGPEGYQYLRQGLPVFQRLSEWESPSFSHPKCPGTVLDAFEARFEKNLISSLAKTTKPTVMLISPELHRRAHLDCWNILRDQLRKKKKSPTVLLCTDHPYQAREFFV